MKTLLLTAALIATATACAAQEGPLGRDVPKTIGVRDSGSCPDGQSLTYVLQCDPGSRSTLDRIWNPQGAGAEICRVNRWYCSPVAGLDRHPVRPGHEVRDSPEAGGMAAVTFGLGRLLGDEPY
jgi:hypothetical protein